MLRKAKKNELGTSPLSPELPLVGDRIRGWLSFALLLVWALWVFGLPYFGFPVLHEITAIPSAPFARINDDTSWLPLAVEVSRGNIFAQGGLTSSFFFVFRPWLSIWVSGILISFFGISGLQFIGHVIMPVVSVLMAALVFQRFVPRWWAAALAAIAFVSFSDLPFHQFVLAILKGDGWRDLGMAQMAIIAGTPMPSISLLPFLVAFHVSLLRRRITLRRLTFLSILWGLQGQFHFLSGLFGYVFWLLYLCIRYRRQEKGRAHIGRLIFFQYFLMLFFALPTFIGIFQSTSVGGFFRIDGEDTRFVYEAYHLVTYFLFPLVALAVVLCIQRIDMIDVALRFWPVWTFMAIEIAFVVFDHSFGRAPLGEVLFLRMGVFLHVLYFVPVIHYLTRPADRYTFGPESRSISVFLRMSLYSFFVSG